MSSSRANICSSTVSALIHGLASRATILFDAFKWIAGARPAMTITRPFQPSLWVAGTAARGRERAYQVRHGLQIVDRPQFVNMRQHGPNALALGLETREAQ